MSRTTTSKSTWTGVSKSSQRFSGVDVQELGRRDRGRLKDLYQLLINIGYIDQDDIDWSGTLLGTQHKPTYYGPKPKAGIKIEILPESYTVDYSDYEDVKLSRHSYKFPKDKRRKLPVLPPHEVALTGGKGVIQRWYQCYGPLEEVVVEDAVDALEDIMRDIRKLDLIPLRGVGMLEFGHDKQHRKAKNLILRYGWPTKCYDRWLGYISHNPFRREDFLEDLSEILEEWKEEEECGEGEDYYEKVFLEDRAEIEEREEERAEEEARWIRRLEREPWRTCPSAELRKRRPLAPISLKTEKTAMVSVTI
ncbi:uncharacterized protein AB675_11424 [Cyphellophora attinorum]|uniref:Uncharacterized protein n=1 Tax=Cyphellophora attinorum TaxID=1664694 RepID=A0A0N1P0K5_9EURO|nr:uncharacterized protein AB675_11424 [Phialophora attinorum]KPI40157.1 hypothetical protein AB675_11424 [Phialophora attinorum]